MLGCSVLAIDLPDRFELWQHETQPSVHFEFGPHWRYHLNVERLLSSLVSVILGLVLSPIAMVLAIWGWARIGGADNPGMLLALTVGASVFVLVVWKSPAIVRGGLDRLRAQSPEPLYSCLGMGITLALATGALMAVPIFLLGHTRPQGWDLDSIPTFMAGAFLLGLIFGARLGLDRRRERKSQTKAIVL